ncbi:Mu transposase C-terminal domain-containing protein [Faecalibaculum rodentium]|jgi:putative transposase|uniref:Mu transposase C-terminal domain-containing protein n=1 Tax=Faecalibaculum rodentium TaxID=1702221 RepID=UPI00272D8C52|nr:Mu transposase C-terminal domain-containing protein [Faecalibaculum rodentium]
METRLSTQEVARLYGKDERTIRRWAKSGKIQAASFLNEFNSPEYLFPLDALDASIQEKYFAQLKASLPVPSAVTPLKRGTSRPLDHYTAEEREEITWWLKTVDDWQRYRSKYPGSKAEADDRFIALCAKTDPEHEFSIDTLYRRWKSIKQNDLDGLIDKRGKWKKGKSDIQPEVWDAFLYFYLQEAQHPMMKCYEYMKLLLREDHPDLVADIPSYTTFTRRVKSDIPEAVEVLGREGQKAFRDRCAPYIRRTYESMASNEWWIADNHTFDVITQGDNGQRHRLHLTAFFDARSGIFTGCHVTENPCSQATLIALRKGILKYGIPENIYVDNGREFLTFDIGGLGHRKKKPKDGQERFEPPPVFERLGIKMTNAIVRNAKAKIIERRFRDVKDHLSRLFDTYTGGNVLEKPERLKGVLKNGEIPLDGTFTQAVEELLDWYFNQQPYGGEVVADRGKPRQQVYNENLHTKRVAGAEDLSLMLMRSARPQKVTRRGVHLDIAGQRLDYWNDDMLMSLLGKQVYFRYDPDDLSEVRVYDLEDRYIMTVPVDNTAVLTYGASREDVKEAMGKVRRMERLTREALKVSAYPAFGKRTALELVMEQAYQSKTARIVPSADPKVLELQRPDEEPLLRAVAGGPDLDVMNRNALKRKGGSDHE